MDLLYVKRYLCVLFTHLKGTFALYWILYRDAEKVTNYKYISGVVERKSWEQRCHRKLNGNCVPTKYFLKDVVLNVVINHFLLFVL